MSVLIYEITKHHLPEESKVHKKSVCRGS